MALIAGTKYYIDLTVNQDLVFLETDCYVYCYKLNNITSSTVWSEITSSSNIGVVDAVTGIQCPKTTFGFIDTVNKTGVLYWCGNTYSNARFYICIGSSISVANTSTFFSDCGYYTYNPLCEENDAELLVGSGYDLTRYTHDIILGNEGKIYKCIENVYSAYSTVYKEAEHLHADDTISFIFKCNRSGGQAVFSVNPNNQLMYLSSNVIYLGNVGLSNLVSFDYTINLHEYYYCSINFLSNGDATLIVNGDVVNTLNIGTFNVGSTILLLSRNTFNPFWGSIEQFSIGTFDNIANKSKTDYNMFFSNASFFGNNFTPISASKPHKNRVNLRLSLGM